MQVIGLVGGMSWESTALYYSLINQHVRERLGGLHSARIVLYSVDFAEIESLQRAHDWNGAAELLSIAARSVEAAGADFVLLCTNTMHIVADVLQSRLRIPLHHIADATAREISRQGLRKVGLLGTRFTMEDPFYAGRLRERNGIDAVVPGEGSRALIHRVIYDELCQGKILDTSRRAYLAAIDELVQRGAEGIILGCTEIGMLISPDTIPVPCFDTTVIHARSAVERALS